MRAEMAELQKVDAADGMNFAAKMAMWVAFERQLESQRPNGDRLFDDVLRLFFIWVASCRL